MFFAGITIHHGKNLANWKSAFQFAKVIPLAPLLGMNKGAPQKMHFNTVAMFLGIFYNGIVML